MAKYHVKKDGTPGVCHAQEGNCPLGDSTEHFSSVQEAQDYADKINESRFAKHNNFALNKLVDELIKKGARTFYVGGCVRDELLGKENKDIDIEIHNISEDDFTSIAENQNIDIDYVGKSFGVYKANLEGEDFDFSFPRTEQQTGDKHTDFEVTVDPFIGEKKAAERRDFTINALMKNTQTGEILDFHGGVNDLKNGVIRHCSDKFSEDALRVFRAAQFASRFNFKIAPETVLLSKKLDCSKLAKERIYEETSKAILKSDKPSVYFKNLIKLDADKSYFPKLTPKELIKIDTLSKGFKKSYPNETVKAIVSEIYKGKVPTITKDTDVRDMKMAFEYLESHSNKYIENQSKENLGNFVYKSEYIKQENNPSITLFKNALIKGKSIAEGNSLVKNFELNRKLIRDEYVTGKDLINLGFKPSKEFSIIIDDSMKFASQGGKKEDFIKNLTNK